MIQDPYLLNLLEAHESAAYPDAEDRSQLRLQVGWGERVGGLEQRIEVSGPNAW